MPRSSSNFVTVFFAAPVRRTVARIELPSTRQPMTCALASVLNRLTILTIMLEGSDIFGAHNARQQGLSARRHPPELGSLPVSRYHVNGHGGAQGSRTPHREVPEPSVNHYAPQEAGRPPWERVAVNPSF